MDCRHVIGASRLGSGFGETAVKKARPAIKILITVIILLIAHFEYRLWVGDASIAQIREYRQRLETLTKEAKEKKDRNDALYAEVLDLRSGLETIEERARYDLGMVKENETFFQVLE